MPSVLDFLEPLLSAEAARALDARTIDGLGVPGIVLMEHAGRAVADKALEVAGAGPILVVAGPGNNGGDGWVCARHLYGRGVFAPVLAWKAPDELKGDAALAARMFERCADQLGWRAPDKGAAWRKLESAAKLEEAIASMRPALVVDALFGTGLSRPLEGLAREVVEALLRLDLAVLSVDLPSGLGTDGEAPPGPCLKARWTVTFATRKIAHASEPGRFFCGEVRVVDVGILRDPAIVTATEVWAAPPFSPSLLPPASPRAHKGSFGHVGVLAGTARTAGAARLAARGVLRAGAGLVSLLVSPAQAGSSVREMPEVMQRTLDDVDAALAGLDALVIGPGLGRSEADLAKARALLTAAEEHDLPCVIDADALLLFAEDEAMPKARVIATPHPGEAGRVLGRSSKEVQANRLDAIRALRQRSDALGGSVTWLLKGACPLVLDRSGRIIVCEGGTRALAVGGSGDVLSGMLGALLAQGLSPDEAAVLGALVHQEAGRRLAERARGGHLASEIADAVQDVLFSRS